MCGSKEFELPEYGAPCEEAEQVQCSEFGGENVPSEKGEGSCSVQSDKDVTDITCERYPKSIEATSVVHFKAWMSPTE